METEQNNKISFLDINVIREQGKFVTSVNRKSIFSSVYTHFYSFLSDTYKIAIIYTLINRWFWICSSWSTVDQQLILLKRNMIQKNVYPENFIDRCFKLFVNRIHILKERVSIVEKRSLRLFLPYLETVSLQTRTKLQKSIKVLLNCCKLQIILKS